MLWLVISLEENHFLTPFDFLETLPERIFEFFNFAWNLVRKLKTRWMMRDRQNLNQMVLLNEKLDRFRQYIKIKIAYHKMIDLPSKFD